MLSIFYWSQISCLGSSLPARLSLLFPLVANLAIFNKYVVEQFSGHEVLFKTVPELHGQFEFYIYYTFCGLSVFALGQSLFTIFCPPLIKKHLDADEFLISLTNANVSKAVLMEWAHYAEDSNNISVSEKSFEGIASAITTIEGSRFNISEMSEQVVNIGRMYYKAKNTDYPIIRIVASMLFTIGLTLMLFPSFNTIIKASKTLF